MIGVKPTDLVALALFTSMLAMGQGLFKRAGLAIRGHDAAGAAIALLTLPTFYAALALYGGATILWIWILSRVPLSQAYPWVAVGTVIVPLIGVVAFGERVSPVFWAGAALIVAGIWLTQLGVVTASADLRAVDGS